MFILVGFRKSGETKVISIDSDREKLKQLANRLFPLTGKTDRSQGLWDNDDILGNFWIEEIDLTDPYQNGVDFLNYKDLK